MMKCGGVRGGGSGLGLYIDQSGRELLLQADYIETPNTHGTGCTLSAAIAAYRALDYTLEAAVQQAHMYTHGAIRHGADVKTGNGKGPLNHFYNPQKLIKHKLE